ncbi:MAG: cytidine/deoxycytidylate deaminase family protein [Candidatus Omnitrophica bacterium]|nr:cytidine/deoxycytidylate deaminase family protein [Candidatus Omnitrophota bacterium]MDD5238295.1 cytidine/deoxycytidylate deaminase family protein [Candidatus Omnitrophota bacterium]
MKRKIKAKHNRPSWDEYFLEMARLVSKRSTCLRRKVGAILVKNKRILATGYNGAPSGLKHCIDIGCIRDKLKIPSGERHELCRALHAEQNALIQAALYGVSVKAGTLYATNQPCIICAKMLINAGIKEIVINNGYPDKMAMDFLKEAKIKVRTLKAINS